MAPICDFSHEVQNNARDYGRSKKIGMPSTVSLSTSSQPSVQRNNFYYILVNGKKKKSLKCVLIILFHPQKPSWLRQIKHQFIISQLDTDITGAHSEYFHMYTHHLGKETLHSDFITSLPQVIRNPIEKMLLFIISRQLISRNILVVPCKVVICKMTSNLLGKWRTLCSLQEITALGA